MAVLGLVVKSPSGFPVANPYLAVAKDSQRQLRQWAGVLRLHNCSRPTAEDGDQDDQAGGLWLLGGSQKRETA